MRPITPTSTLGITLLALRAGPMEPATIRERWPTSNGGLTELGRLGLIEQVDGLYRLTEAGRAACPSRRSAQPEPMHAEADAKRQKQEQRRRKQTQQNIRRKMLCKERRMAA